MAGFLLECVAGFVGIRTKGHGKKFYDLVRLVEDGENIITTHALFSKMDRDLYAKLSEAGYELIIDEVLETVTLYKGLSAHDRAILRDQNMTSVDPITWRLTWNQEQWGDYDGEFREVKRLCETGSLVVFRERTMLWEFPSEFLRCFSKVTVATYMFDASPFAAYLKNEGFTFNRQTVNGNLTTPSLVPWEHARPIEAALKARLRELVTVHGGPMNDIGREGWDNGKRASQAHPFSSGWLGRQTADVLKKVQASTSNFFLEVAKAPANKVAWTTVKEHRTSLKGRGYARSKDRKSNPDMCEGEGYGFLPWTAQATNDYCEVEAMAYLMNVYYHPDVKAYFEALGGNVSQDLYALSALLQWVWRSRIRRSQPIKLFIPSERMRDLFNRWLAADSTPALALVRNQPLDLTGWWGGSYSSIRREIRRIRY